jgi:hypothetical protein
MNEIRVKRMILGGLATLVVWIAVAILVEQVVGRMIFGDRIQELWLEATHLGQWDAQNETLNIVIAVLNSTLLIWLYASLRPMYGVGAKTALITSAFGFAWAFSMIANGINLGLFPAQAGLVEAAYEAIEFPVSILAGAAVYEGSGDERRSPGQ